MTTTAQPALTPFAEEWLKDLEAETHPQAQGMLRDLYGGFCCLGRACDLNDSKLWVEIDADTHSPRFEYMNTSTRLPNDVQDRLNFDDASGEFVITDDFLARLPKELVDRVLIVSENTCQNLASSEDYTEDDFPEGYCALTDLNDSGFTFPEIAAVVRARPEGLFID